MSPAPLSPRMLAALRIAVTEGIVYAGRSRARSRSREIRGGTVVALEARGLLSLAQRPDGRLYGRPTAAGYRLALRLATRLRLPQYLRAALSLPDGFPPGT